MSAVAADRQRRRLTARARKLALVVHVVSSVGLVGSSAGVLILALSAAAADEAVVAHALYVSMRTAVFAVAVPFSFIALGSGIVLGLGTKWGVLRHGWVTAKLVLLVVIILTGVLVVRPSMEHVIAATSAPGAKPDLGASQWEPAAAAASNIVLAVAAVVLAIFKPGGRLRRRTGAHPRRRATLPA
jgi:predicted integral membrane protein DUF2269